MLTFPASDARLFVSAYTFTKSPCSLLVSLSFCLPTFNFSRRCICTLDNRTFYCHLSPFDSSMNKQRREKARIAWIARSDFYGVNKRVLAAPRPPVPARDGGRVGGGPVRRVPRVVDAIKISVSSSRYRPTYTREVLRCFAFRPVAFLQFSRSSPATRVLVSLFRPKSEFR